MTLPRGREVAPSIRSTCRPTLDAVAHSSCQFSTRFRLNPCIFGLNTLPKSFLPPHTPKTRALATPEQVATAPVPSRGGARSGQPQLPRPVTTRRAPMASRRSGGGEPALDADADSTSVGYAVATRLYCAHTRGITHYACKVFFLDFWHFFVAFLYDFFCIHSTFDDGVWLAFAAMRLIVRCPRRIVAPFFVAGGGGVRQPRRGQAAPCAQGCTDTTQVTILQLLAQ